MAAGKLTHNIESVHNRRLIVLLIGCERYLFLFDAGREFEVLEIMASYAWERDDLNFTGEMVRIMADRFHAEGVI